MRRRRVPRRSRPVHAAALPGRGRLARRSAQVAQARTPRFQVRSACRSTVRYTESMSVAAKQILEAALQLDPKERELIADALWDSLEAGDDEVSVEKAWEEEVARRAKELDEGRAEPVDWDDVKARIANRLGER